MAGMTRTAVVLLLIMPMALSSAMMPKMVSGGGVAGDGDHVQAHACKRLSWPRASPDDSEPVLGRADHAGILGYGDERAGQAANRGWTP